jgi:hypothetical protein
MARDAVTVGVVDIELGIGDGHTSGSHGELTGA